MATFPTTYLQPGSPDVLSVRQLQDWLTEQGYLTPEQVSTGYGIYGPQTTAAVMKWQRDNGVDTSTGPGYWGPNTIQTAQAVSQMNQGQSRQSRGASSQQGAEQQTGGIMGGTPYFMGDYSLVRFSGQGPTGHMNENIVWLIDPNTRTLRPFRDQAALSNFFETPVNPNDVNIVSAAELMPGGLLGSQGGQPGYDLLGNEYAVNSDGTAKRLDYSNSQIAARYGHSIDEVSEQNASMILDGFLDSLARTDSGMDVSALNDLRGNTDMLAFYINALAYGGYTLNDIYRDVKAKELGIDDQVIPISATATRQNYRNTNEGQYALSDTRVTPPPAIGGLSGTDLNLSIYDLPDEAFKTLIPVLDIDSEEFKQRMDEIETAYHDILLQQLNANTEQEKAVADYNWETFRDDLGRTYGIQLSNNALDAWDQIQNAYSQFAQGNIYGSGIQQEAIDDYLNKVRRSDQITREEQISKEESERMNYYRNYATAAQVQALANSDPETAKKWGLIPSDQIKNELTLDELKKKYPNTDEATLQRYIASVVDENGNYRSSLFQRQLANTQSIESDKRLYQQQMALQGSLRDEEKAYREFTTPDSPFLRATEEGENDTRPYRQPREDDTINLRNETAQTPAVQPGSGSPQMTNAQIQKSINDALQQAQSIQRQLSSRQTPVVQQTTQAPVVTPTRTSGATSPSSLPTPLQNNQQLSTFNQSATQTSTPSISSGSTIGKIGSAVKSGWNKLTSFF